MANFITPIPEFAFPHELDRIIISSTNKCTFEFFSANGVEMTLSLTPDANGQIIIEDFAQVLRDVTAEATGVMCEIYLEEVDASENSAAEFYVRACRQDLNTTASEFCNKHFFSLVKGPKPTYLGAEELLFADNINKATATLIWINPQTGDVKEIVENISMSGDNLSTRINVSPSRFTSPATDYKLHSYQVFADSRTFDFIVQSCVDAIPVSFNFRNAFGYFETFHCFGATLTELKPTRSTASFDGKTKNYRVLAIPEHTTHTGVIPHHLVDLFADLCSATEVFVLSTGREVCITDCDFKISNDLYTPQQATITWRESARAALHEPFENVRTFDESFDETFY